MTLTQLVIAAGLAAAVAAVRSHGLDRRLNGRHRRGSGGARVPLTAVGRRVVGMLPVLATAPPWAARSLPAGMSHEEAAAFRVGAGVVLSGLGLAGALVLGGTLGVLAGITLAGFGAVYADLWLRAAYTRRRELVQRAAPGLLELVAASVAAGVGIDAALRAAAAAVSGPLADELALAHANIELGRGRGAELHDAAERTGSSALAGLALAVSLSERLGVPLADGLRRQAARARADRACVVQERAAAAGPKLLVVVVFVLVPAALLPLLAAVGLSVAATAGRGL